MIIHQAHNSLGNYNYNAYFYKDCEWFYHFHKNYELIYVLEGEVELTLNGKKLSLGADTFALVLPNEFHSYHTPNYSYAWIGVFSSDFVGEVTKVIRGKRTNDPRFFCESTVKSLLLKYLITESSPDILLMKAMLYAVCREFINNVELEESGQEENFANTVISYVSENFREDISLAQIAKELRYEYHYLSRQFSRHFGMGFKQFLNIFRMDFAKEQLLKTKDDITKVAYNSGFHTVRTFNRTFLEQTGMTPTDFRKNNLFKK